MVLGNDSFTFEIYFPFSQVIRKFCIQDILHDQLSVDTCYTKIDYNISVLQTCQYMSLVELNKKYKNDEKNVGEPEI